MLESHPRFNTADKNTEKNGAYGQDIFSKGFG